MRTKRLSDNGRHDSYLQDLRAWTEFEGIAGMSREQWLGLGVALGYCEAGVIVDEPKPPVETPA